jgi:hypothetical protein
MERAFDPLGLARIPAGSPQARGRRERLCLWGQCLWGQADLMDHRGAGPPVLDQSNGQHQRGYVHHSLRQPVKDYFLKEEL